MIRAMKRLRSSLKTALVTGAAGRIGRAIALDLGRHGWSVAIHYRSRESEAQEVAAELTALGVRAALLEADLTREEQTSALVERAGAVLGPIGCLINNAAAFEPDLVDTVTRASWDLHLETNLRAPFVLIQQFARQLPPDESGNVINLLDQRVWNPTPFFISYTVSKSALWTSTRTLALALAPRIRVNAVGPGPTLKSARQSERDFERQWESTPLGRGTTPQEICDAVGFILGAPAMTGQMIALDGGQHLGWAHRSPGSPPRE
jgi:NAD(P)-dependent dehydrogenase (short-subunit alcohol dehydrogenase family)